MRRLLALLVLPAVAAAVILGHDPLGGAGQPAQAAAGQAPAEFGQQLRYIGRDYLTGMPATVDDRFIAKVERAIADYGKEEAEAIPPPTPGPVDIARIEIPALRVSAPVGRYGVDKSGRLDVPTDASTVGWNPGFVSPPGFGGTTFFAAHFYYGGVPGVFNRISQLASGDIVTVTLSDGSRRNYRVTSTIDYALAAIDMGAILAGREGAESITLMTCSGPPNEGNYPFRTVVLAVAVEG